MSLSPKQQRFVAEYLIDSNGAQAAIRAGYAAGSAKVTASKLLTKANVRDAVEAGRAKIAGKLEITAEGLVRDVMEIGQEARGEGAFPAALKACEMLGRSLGRANPFAETVNIADNDESESTPERQEARLLLLALELMNRRGKTGATPPAPLKH